MIRLTLLRGIGLVDASGRSIDAVVRQPKRFAVLAYLALAGRELGCQRDALLGLFWPDLTQSRARQALNAATHFLRQHLGQDVIVSRGPDALGIEPGAVWCDATAFLDTVEQDPEAALQLYSGDLLPGFYVGAGHEFDRWLSEERRRLRDLAAHAARQLAEHAAAGRDMPGAIRLARRLIDLADNDEILVRQAIALMGRADDRSGALDAYSRFASRLSEEYPGARPSAETVAIVERIRSAESAPERPDDPVVGESPGVAAHAPAAAFSPASSPAPAPVRDDSTFPPRRAVPSWRSAIASHRWAVGLISGATLTTALLLTAAVRGSHKAQPEASALPRVEIAGFTALDHSPASAQAAAVLTEDLTARLARTASLDVVERRDDRARGAAGARDVPADLVARGSIARSGTGLVIGVALVDGREGTTLRTARFQSADGVPQTKDTLATRIARLVQETLDRQLRLRRMRQSLGDERLYRLVQDVEEDRMRADTLREQGQSQAAARALANADATLVTVERAAPANADVRTTRSTVLATLAVSYFLPPMRDAVKLRATLAQAVADADTAMSLDSASADAAEAFASAAGMLVSFVPLPADSDARVSARIERALHRAISIDPLRPSAWTQLSRILYTRGDFVGAYDAARHAYDIDAFGANDRELLIRLSAGAYELGDDSASAHWCANMTRRYPHEWTTATCEIGVIAHTDRPTPSAIREAWRLADEISRTPGAAPLMGPREQMLVAAALAHAGLRDSAEHVVSRAHAIADGDAEMPPFEAEARAALGERAAADSMIRRYVAIAPDRRAYLLRSRRFGPLPRS